MVGLLKILEVRLDNHGIPATNLLEVRLEVLLDNHGSFKSNSIVNHLPFGAQLNPELSLERRQHDLCVCSRTHAAPLVEPFRSLPIQYIISFSEIKISNFGGNAVNQCSYSRLKMCDIYIYLPNKNHSQVAQSPKPMPLQGNTLPG